MRDIDLLRLALGLVPPWMAVAADFDAEKKRLDIEIDFKTGSRFLCLLLDGADARWAARDLDLADQLQRLTVEA
jgi:hypothetical protein